MKTTIANDAMNWLSGYFNVGPGDIVVVSSFVRDFADCHDLYRGDAREILIRAILNLGAWPRQ